MRPAFVWIYLFFALNILFPSAQAATYYVSSSTGSDSNPGTQSHPWLNLQYAFDRLQTGDTLYIRGGTYTPIRYGHSFKNSGTMGNPITVTNYPGEQVILKIGYADESYRPIRCVNFTFNVPSWNTPKSHYVRIIGTDVAPSTLSNGVVSRKGIVIQGVHGAQWSGIQAYGCDNWEVAGIDFVEVASGLFIFAAHNETVDKLMPVLDDNSADGWYVHDNRVYNYYRESGMQFASNNNIVENNEIYKVSSEIFSPYGCYHLNFNGHNNTIRNNTISRLGSTIRCGGIIFEWDLSDNNIAEKNNISDVINGIDIQGGDNNLVRNNIIYGSALPDPYTGGIQINSYDNKLTWPCDEIGSGGTLWPPDQPGHPEYAHFYPHDCRSFGNQIYNNVVHNYAIGIKIYNVTAADTVIRNNALSGWTKGPVCYYNAPTDSCKTLDANVTSGWNADHDFGFADAANFDFHLLPSSPLTDSGYNLGNLVPDDFDGNARPQGLGWDIGAYEYAEAPPCSDACSPSGSTRCVNSSYYQTCGNYNNDSCLEWGSPAGCGNGTCLDGQCIPESYDMKGHWRLDEESGNLAQDSSGNGNIGTLVNGPFWVKGRIGNGLEFDGMNDRMVVPNSVSLNPSSAITMSAWIFPREGGSMATVISKWTPAVPDFAYKMDTGSSGLRVRGYVWTSPTQYCQAQDISDLTLNQWNHFAYTFDGSSCFLFRNGIQVAWTPNGGTILHDGTGSLSIGASDTGSWNSEFFNGPIDDIRIYNRALSATEIQQLFAQAQSCIHQADNAPCDGCISMPELLAFINLWKQSSTAIPMRDMMEAVGLWKAGNGC